MKLTPFAKPSVHILHGYNTNDHLRSFLLGQDAPEQYYWPMNRFRSDQY